MQRFTARSHSAMSPSRLSLRFTAGGGPCKAAVAVHERGGVVARKEGAVEVAHICGVLAVKGPGGCGGHGIGAAMPAM